MVVDIAAQAGPDEDFTDKVNEGLEKIIETLSAAVREEAGQKLWTGSSPK